MSKIITAFQIVCTSIIVGLYAYLGSFSRLMADDFCSVYFRERLGFFRSIWYWYITWHGGYSASFADALLGSFGGRAIGYIVPLIVFFWFLCLVWAISSLFSNHGMKQHSWIVVSVVLLILYGTTIVSPNTSASVIWWGGLRGYIPPLIIMPVYIGLYALFLKRNVDGRIQYIWYLLSFGIIFFNGGFSENFTPLQIIILSLMLTHEIYLRRDTLKNPKVYFLIAGILGGVLALIFMVLAPGNVRRQVFFPPPALPLDFMSIALKSYLTVLTNLLFDLQKIIAVLGVFTGSMRLGTLMLYPIKFKIRTLFIIIATGLLLAYGCYLPAAYGQSTGPSDASLIIPTYILIITVVIIGILCGGTLLRATKDIRHKEYILILSLILFIPLGYSTILKARELSAEIARATVYSENWVLRDQQIKQAKLDGRSVAVVPAMEKWIALEPTDNPRFFVNQCMSLYYGIDVLSIDNVNR